MAKSDEEMRQEAERLLHSANVPIEGSVSEGFMAMHEMFIGLQEGGFTLGQALWIIGFVVCSGSSKYPGMENDSGSTS